MNQDDVQDVNDDSADEAAFAEGASNEVAAKTPTATPEPEQVAAEKKETPAPTPEPEYVQLTKAELEDLRAIRATQEKSFGTAFGKIGGIERVLQELKAQPALGELSEDDFIELKGSFPELSEMTVKGLNRSLAKLRGQPGPTLDPTKVDELVQQGVTKLLQAREAQSQTEAREALTKEHPDWHEVKDKPEFKAWLDKQPARRQKTYAKTWDADFLSDVFGDFKTAAKAAKEASDKTADAAARAAAASSSTRKDRLLAAVTPRGTGGHAPAPSDDDDFESGFKSG